MKTRYKFSLLVIAILLAFSMTVGTSYAFWTKSAVQTNSNEIVAGCLEIEINDVKVDEGGNTAATNINLINAYPMSDTKGLNTKPYELTIKNVCNLDANYTVVLNTLSTSALTEAEVKYHFVKVSPTVTTMTPTLINTMNLASLDRNLVAEMGSAVGGIVQNSYVLSTGVLLGINENVVDSVTYNLRLWIDESADNNIMGNTYEAAVAVYAEVTDVSK